MRGCPEIFPVRLPLRISNGIALTAHLTEVPNSELLNFYDGIGTSIDQGYYLDMQLVHVLLVHYMHPLHVFIVLADVDMKSE